MGKLGEVAGEELGHAEGADALVAEDLQGRSRELLSRHSVLIIRILYAKG